MCSKSQVLILLLFLLTFSLIIDPSLGSTGGIAIYWGQNNGDGSLTDTCDSNKYEIVLLAFLVQFGGGRQVQWNFAGHCGDWSPCTKLEPEIKHCQAKGVKVLLSLGGADVYAYDYGLTSAQDAKNVAKYLYDNFLNGQYGPLGSVTLDGIDFDIEKTELYWEDLARELDTYRQNKYFYLSAAPQCPTEPKIYYLEKAIQTGLFDYIFIQFYNNPQCAYSTSAGTSLLLQSWDKWASLVKSNNSIFLGLPAAESAAGSGYIPPEVVISDVLPHIKETSNYGGVMLWDRFRDKDSDFSGKILPYVPKSNVLLQTVTAVWEGLFYCVSATLHRIKASQ
ncbi:putative chitinase [Lupinus albus]|uniref:Acidic endochitinase n=1 Tax=Lupinus albus TaxID=3870 RepID=A0A6A4NI41_LUPAL|nr:putative chitinase [Lupinus albus]